MNQGESGLIIIIMSEGIFHCKGREREVEKTVMLLFLVQCKIIITSLPFLDSVSFHPFLFFFFSYNQFFFFVS